MDSTRFDELTRMLVAGRSRRRLLQGLAGAALAGSLGLLGQEATEAHNAAAKCRKLQNPKMRRTCLNRAKQHNRRHRSQPPPGPTCAAVLQTCTVDSDCCSDFCADTDPPNGPKLCGCTSFNRGCQADAECCSGTCDAAGTGMCTCHQAATVCSDHIECCPGLTCQNQQPVGDFVVGTCQPSTP